MGGAAALVLRAASPAETAAIAAALAAGARPGDCLALDGPLGAGKTLFVAAYCAALGVPAGEVDSPSFVLLNEYAGGHLPLYHFDAYRLAGGEEELLEAGFFDERLRDGVCMIEWAARLADFLPAGALRIALAIAGETERQLSLSGWPAARLAALAPWRTR